MNEYRYKTCISSKFFGYRVSVSPQHCVFDWPDCWLWELSSTTSVTISITSNLLTQKISSWHNWFLYKIHSAFILFLTSPYKVSQKISSSSSMIEKQHFIIGAYSIVQSWSKAQILFRNIPKIRVQSDCIVSWVLVLYAANPSSSSSILIGPLSPNRSDPWK